MIWKGVMSTAIDALEDNLLLLRKRVILPFNNFFHSSAVSLGWKIRV